MKNKPKNIAKNTAASEKKLTIIVNLVTVILFFGTLMTFACITAFSEKETFSENQNRNLASFPEFSAKKLFSGAYTDGIETFVSDHFAGHDKWITVKTALDMLSGKREANNIYILKNRLVEKIAEPDMEIVDKSILGIRKFAEDNNITPYLMLIPTQAEIYKDELPPDAPNPDQQEFIGYVYGALEGCTAPIDVYSVLSANRKDYIYYRTDHHWTTRGAFLGYTAAAKKLDLIPLTEADYDIEHAGKDFRGTFYSKVLYDGVEPDTLDLWLPSVKTHEPVLEITSVFGEAPAVHEGFYFREYLDVKDKYSTFLGPNQPMVTIKTGNDGGKLLMIKDSYSHSMAPFLAAHYSEITLIDLRYIQMSIKQLVDVSEYDRVLIAYNVSTFMSDENVKKLMF